MMEAVYHVFDDFINYRNDWNILAKSFNNPMLYFDWFRYCVKNFHNNEKLFVFCIIEKNRLIAAAPLCQSYKNGKLKIIGNDNLYEPTSFLFKDTQILNQLLCFILKSNIPLELNRLPVEYRNYIDRVQSLKYYFIKCIETRGSQYLNKINSYNTFMATLSSKRKSDLRRFERRLKAMGNYRYDICFPTNLEIPLLLREAFVIENRSWKGDKKSSMINNDKLRNFISEIFTYFSNGNSLISILYSNNTAIACNLSIIVDDTLWMIKIGYDSEYSSCSPGVLLTHNIIEYCCNNDISRVEFLGSTENWINLWRPQEAKYMTLLYYPASYNSIKILINDVISIIKVKIKTYFSNDK